MNSVTLVKGENASLPVSISSLQILVEVGHGHDVDAGALLLDEHRQVRSDDDFVFFNQPSSQDGTVRHLGRQTRPSTVCERLHLGLRELTDDVTTVALTASVTGSNFESVGRTRVIVTDSSGVELVVYELADAGPETAVVLAEVYRRGDGWKVRAVGQGWSTGLEGLATDFGITVESESTEAPTGTGAGAGGPGTAVLPLPASAGQLGATAPTLDLDDPSPRGQRRFNAPPGWPSSPPGWVPPPGWQPLSTWPAPPAGWQFWVASETAAPPRRPGVSLFGAKKKAQALISELDELRSEVARLGVLDVVELERRRSALAAQIAEQEARLQADLDRQATALAVQQEQAAARCAKELASLTSQVAAQQQRLATLSQQVVVTEDSAILQEAGVYSYRHPLSDAAAYQAELAGVRDATKAMVRRDGGAIEAATGWTVNGSASQGRTMVNDFSKLMLRAYNAEADNLVRGLKPYKLATSVERLDKVAATIARLGSTMSIRVAVPYHRLRIRELELTADYLEKLAVEKEREREEKERLREERKVQQEIEREKERLVKERSHYQNVHAALLAKGDLDGAARMADELESIERAMQDVDYRAANIRAGYVYVISNVGAFGERMVKVGMTRRLVPMDRVKELGDASVPFGFDVHALFFAEDAVGIEGAMHARLADRRVNRVNLRREFFYATPTEARDHLLELTGPPAVRGAARGAGVPPEPAGRADAGLGLRARPAARSSRAARLGLLAEHTLSQD